MKSANAYYKKNVTMKGYAGLTDEQTERTNKEIAGAYSWNKQPYPSYLLQNNNQNLHRIEKRIESLMRETGEQAEAHFYDTDKLGFEVLENKEAMRLQLYFDGKPEEEIRDELKGNGFKWSPKNECWQRLLNDNARYALKRVITSLSEMQASSAGSEM